MTHNSNSIWQRIKDWAVGPGGWLADSDRDHIYAAIDQELDAIEARRRGGVQPRRAADDTPILDMTPRRLSEAELDAIDLAATDIDLETDRIFNQGHWMRPAVPLPEFPPVHLRIASQTANLKRTLAAYQDAVERYANRLADPAAYADPSIQTDDTLIFVDDGLGEDYETELEWYDRRD